MPLGAAIGPIIGGIAGGIGSLFGGGGGDSSSVDPTLGSDTSGITGDLSALDQVLLGNAAGALGDPNSQTIGAGLGGIFSSIMRGLAGGGSTAQGLASLGTGLLGTLLQHNATGNYQNLLQNALNFNQGLVKQGVSNVGQFQQPAQKSLLNILAGGGFNNPQAVQQYLQQVQGLGQNVSQGIQSALSGFGPAQSVNVQNALARVFSGLDPAMGTANSIIANQGQSPQLQALLNSFLGVGSNRVANAMGNTAANILGTQGQTPALQAGQLAALAMMLNSGRMATPRPAVLPQAPVLSLGQAASIARNQAATANAQQAQNARAQALSLGGGPGAVVANGATNQALGDFANQAAQNEAAAAQNALMQQQGVQLSSYLPYQSLNLQSSLQTQANQLAAQNLAQQLQLGGGSLLAGLTGAQTGLLGTGGGLGSAYNQLQLGGLQGALGTTGMGQQNLYSALGALGNLSGLQGGLANSIGNQFLSGVGQQLQGQQQLFNTGMQSLYPTGNFLQQGAGNMLGANQLLGDMGANWLNFGAGLQSGASKYLKPVFGASPFGNFLAGAGQP